MAIIKFDWAGYEYQTGLKTLKDSYERAAHLLQDDIDASYRAIDEFDLVFDEGVDSVIEADDYGSVTHNPRDFLIHASIRSEQSIQALRKAFAIMIYHHWERAAREWGNKPHGGFEGLVKAVQSKDIWIDPNMVDLHVLVNSLKHNAAIWGQPLFELRPQWFARTFSRDASSIEWFDIIELCPVAMNDLFNWASRSGPANNTGFD